MKLSCIVPHYNDSVLLLESVRALLAQSTQAMEILLIDDASTDGSWRVIEEMSQWDPRIQIFKNEKNQGVVGTLMRGLELAKGEFIYMGSSNDFVLPGFFEEAISVLEKEPKLGLFCAGALLEEGKEQKLSDLGWGIRGRFFSPLELVQQRRKKLCSFHGQSVIFRRAFLPPNRELSIDLRSNFDLFIFFTIALRAGFYFSPRPYARITVAEGCFSSQGRSFREKVSKVAAFMQLLERPYYAEAKRGMIQSGFLSFMGIPILYWLLKQGKLRYISSKFLKDLARTNWEKIAGSS